MAAMQGRCFRWAATVPRASRIPEVLAARQGRRDPGCRLASDKVAFWEHDRVRQFERSKPVAVAPATA